ncbi:MAG: lytic transglycosylase domain-containing protein [Firmicutes bacterium]|nr:lytic transglycosylase domain-containing protein [Bacillota bacterium]
MIVIWRRRFVGILLASLLLLSLFHLIRESRWFARWLYPIKYRTEIFHCSVEHNIDPFLISAIINVESRFYPLARSPRGARGLMQIMPETGLWVAQILEFEKFSPDTLYDPLVNIRIGSWYLSSLQREFNGELTVALAAYNAGHGIVREWLDKGIWDGTEEKLDNIPYQETRKYVRRVLYTYRIYRWAYRGAWENTASPGYAHIALFSGFLHSP